jgi:hypothetical protein
LKVFEVNKANLGTRASTHLITPAQTYCAISDISHQESN